MARATARPSRNMPSNNKTRRRRALTSALNNPAANPDIMDAALQAPSGAGSSSTTEAARAIKDDSSSQRTSGPLASGPLASEAIPSRHGQRKRRRILKEEDDDEQLTATDPVYAKSTPDPIDAGPSSYASRPSASMADIRGSTSDPVGHHPSMTTHTPQQQLQDRSKLLAAQEGKAKLEARVVTLGKEVAFKNDLLSGHHSTLERLKQNFTCNICFELFRDPHALVPCGHTACAPCLLEWFGSVNSLLRPPQHLEEDEIANYLGKHTKCCFTCRAAVTHKPIPSYILKDTVQALSLQLAFQEVGEEDETASTEDNVPPANRATMWDVVFKPVTQRRWFIDEEDHGVRRCSSCGFEIDGRWCHHCDEQYSDISEDSGSELLSSDDDGGLRIPRAFFDVDDEPRWPREIGRPRFLEEIGRPRFLEDIEEPRFLREIGEPRWPREGSDEPRWPGEGSDGDEDDDLQGSMDEDDEFYGRAREWRMEPDGPNGLDGERGPNVRPVGRERPRNHLPRQDFHFGFGGADLEHPSSEEDDHYEGSFIDDDDAGMERHFVRGYDYDGEDSDPSDLDASGSDRSGHLDRHGRPTHLAGRQVVYSPSYDGSSAGSLENTHVANANGHSPLRSSVPDSADGSDSDVGSWDGRIIGGRMGSTVPRARAASSESADTLAGDRLDDVQPIRRLRRRIVSTPSSEDD